MGVFMCSWQLWKPSKNRWFLLCVQPSEGPGGALEGPWGVAWGLGALPEALGEAPRGSLGGSRGIGGLKAKILGGFVIAWGVFGAPLGALGGAQKAMSSIGLHRVTSAGGPWAPPKL